MKLAADEDDLAMTSSGYLRKISIGKENKLYKLLNFLVAQFIMKEKDGCVNVEDLKKV